MVDGQIQPQCGYSIEENPAYTATCTIRQGMIDWERCLLRLVHVSNEGTILLLLLDLFDYEVNPAYTLDEAPHQRKGKFDKLYATLIMTLECPTGIPIYYEIQDLVEAEDTEKSTRVSDAVATESTMHAVNMKAKTMNINSDDTS